MAADALAQTAAPRAWQRMLSGRRLDLLDPSPLDVEIEDIAHGLARVARWNGQTRGDHAFSVAQHSLVVEAAFSAARPQAEPGERLAALLHDAPEYVIGDMISPFKAVVGGGYKAVEKRLQHAIHLRFALPADLPMALSKAIKRADHVAAWFEATLLAGFSEAEAQKFFARPRGLTGDRFSFEPMPTRAAQEAFLARFSTLEALRGRPRARGVVRTAALAALALLAAATAAQAACPQRLGVGHGDTLESIAQACGISVETLRGANPGLTAETLRPGRFIAVPRAALPSPQLPFGRRSVEPVPQLVPPATGASPSRTVIAPPPPAMQHPQMPEGFDTRPQHMRPHPRGPTFGPRFPLQRN